MGRTKREDLNQSPLTTGAASEVSRGFYPKVANNDNNLAKKDATFSRLRDRPCLSCTDSQRGLLHEQLPPGVPPYHKLAPHAHDDDGEERDCRERQDRHVERAGKIAAK